MEKRSDRIEKIGQVIDSKDKLTKSDITALVSEILDILKEMRQAVEKYEPNPA